MTVIAVSLAVGLMLLIKFYTRQALIAAAFLSLIVLIYPVMRHIDITHIGICPP